MCVTQYASQPTGGLLAKTKSKIGKILRAEVKAEPHNGTPQFQIDDWLRPGQKIGGQRLMIRLALLYRRVVMTWGRRGGKSTGCRHLWREEQIVTPGKYVCGYLAQDHTKAKGMFEQFFNDLGGDPKVNPKSLIHSFHRDDGQERWIKTRRFAIDENHIVNGVLEGADAGVGGEYYFWSGMKPQYDNLRGFQFGFHRIVVDEAPWIEAECMSDVILKMLTDLGGKLLVIGTPKAGAPGQSWFETYFRRGQSEDKDWKEWFSANFPSEINPNITPDDHARARKEALTQEEITQELDAKFLTDMGAVFQNLDKVFVIPPNETPQPWYSAAQKERPAPNVRSFFTEAIDPLGVYIIGVDWALKSDHTVISVMRMDGEKPRQVCLLRFPTGNTVTLDTLTYYVKRAHEAYNSANIHSDPNGIGAGPTERLAHRYNEAVLPEEFTYSKKVKYVSRTQMLFQECEIELINWIEQREEFRKYAQLTSAGVYPRYGHPEGVGEHDDMVDPIMMMSLPLSLGPRKPRKKPKLKPAFGTQGWMRQYLRRKRNLDRERQAQI